MWREGVEEGGREVGGKEVGGGDSGSGTSKFEGSRGKEGDMCEEEKSLE